MERPSASLRLGGDPNPFVELQPRLVARAKYKVADRVIYDDVFVNDCYRVADLPKEIKTVVDIGAHIGYFTMKMHRRFPEASFVCVEANPANIEALKANVGHFAAVVSVPCAYFSRANVLSTVFDGTENTGGSFICPAGDETWKDYENADEYRPLERPVKTKTLEQIADDHGLESIDLLKLDCEGSEFDILANSNKNLLRTVVGEWHNRERFTQLVANHFEDWTFDVLRDGELGLFRLSLPEWWTISRGEPKDKFTAEARRRGE